jgi:general secretion pathway protein G
MSRRQNARRAFTLMEILLVLAILVVLGSMVTLGYSKIKVESDKKAARTQIGMLEEATNLYILHVGTPPSSLDSLVTLPPDLPNPNKWEGPYLGKTTLPVDPWNQPYQYEVTDPTNNKFKIWSSGPPGSNIEIATTQ